MTTAVCLRCGEMKLGAFTPCRKCGFEPESPDEQVRSIMLSDQNLDAVSLKEVSEQIGVGDYPEFDEAAVEEAAKQFAEMEPMRRPMGCLIVKWGLIGIMLALAVTLAVLIWMAKREG
jgi:hypothetical protein